MFRKRILWLLLVGLLIPAAMAITVRAFVADVPGNPVQLSVNGERMITLRYGEHYTDPGATAIITDTETGNETTISISTPDTVNTNTVGVYLLRYTAVSDGNLYTAYRRVQILDEEFPVITLVSDPNHYTLPNSEYEEEGYTATDNYDGDLTGKVERTVTKDVIYYTVRDSSGNLTRVTRTILYGDPVPPELTLVGESLVVLNEGDAYTEPGYTAADNCDGDITDRVQVSGWVDTAWPGKYTLTYQVSDNAGNTSSIYRSVFVKEAGVEKINNPSEGTKFIFLTFDDGPGSNTPWLLDILKKYNVPATFFVVNTAYIDTIKRASDEGHTIAIHTTTHKFKEIYASEDAFFNDLYSMQDIIRHYTGETAMLMRFPGGSSNTISSFNKGIMSRLTQLVEEKGFTYFDWNVDSMDAGGVKTAKKVYNNVISGIGDKENAVVLMHDIKSYTIDAIERIIVWGLKNGYTFRALTADSPTCHHGVNN